MGKNLNFARLLDFYGNCLTEKQQEILSYYYNEDYSLSEISEYVGTSRQGVMDIIRRGEAQMNDLESKLHLTKIYNNVDKAIDLLGDNKITDAVSLLSEIRM